MKSIIVVSIALIGTFLAQDSFACEKPGGISLPNGSTATEQEMVAAGNRFHQFMVNMQLYQVCLDDEANRLRLRLNDQSKQQITLRENKYASLHNAASAAMKQTTEAFNRVVEAYQARQ